MNRTSMGMKPLDRAKINWFTVTPLLCLEL